MEPIKKRAKKIVDANGDMNIAHLDAILEISDKLESLSNKDGIQKMELVAKSEEDDDSLALNFYKMLRGKKGDKGDEPADERLTQLITPLIPTPIKGDTGEPGKNYVLSVKDKKDIAKDVKVPVIEKIIERVEIIKETPIITNEIKEVAKHETADEILLKVNSKKGSINLDTVSNLPDILNNIASRQTVGQPTTPRFVDIYENGVSKQQSAGRINFIGATVIGRGGGADVTITGGGSSITLKTNGTNNGSQSILNLKQGTNVTLTDDGVGGVTISSTGGTGTVPTGTGFTHITAGAQDAAAKLVDTADINNSQVTLAKIANVATDTILGRATAVAGVVEELTAIPFAFTGDVTRPADSNIQTLATVNANVGAFTNASVTVNAKGLVTAASSGTAPVTGVTATSPITSSGGTAPVISTSMNTNKLIGRSTAALGVMEEITLGTNLSFTGTTLNAAGGSPGGSTTQLQYNNAGAFAGITGATTNGTFITLVTPVLGVASATSLAVTGTAGAGFESFVAQSAAPTAPAAGTTNLYSSTTNGFTRIMQQSEAVTSIVFGRDNVMLVRNTSGATISKGSAVYVTGSTGNVPNVSMSQANSSTTLPAIGIMVDDVINNAYGQSMLVGIISSLNTSAFSAGASLFVSSTVLGGLTSTRPSGTTNFVQRVGTVLVSGVGNGSIKIAISPSLLNTETGTNAATWTGNAVTASSLTLSGNMSVPAWTTSGIRIKGITATITDTTSTGIVAAAYTDALGGNTIAATSVTTYTDYITAFFKEPVAGTNVTFTRKAALGAESLRIGTSNQLTVSTAGVLTLGAGSLVAVGSTSGTVTLGAPAVAGTTTFTLPGTNGTSGQYLQTNGSGVTSWQTVATGGSISWTTVTTTTQALAVNNGYIANNAGVVTMTLPATAAVGDTIYIQGYGAGLLSIAQNASQVIHFLSTDSTTGVGGSLSTTQRYQTFQVRCVVANNEWSVVAPSGNFTII